MKTSDFDFDLPEELIALRPAEPRDSARMLVVDGDILSDRQMLNLPDCLRPGDTLVFNDTRVIPARLSGFRHRSGTGGEDLVVQVEATLHHRDAPDVWSAFMKPGKRIRPGDAIVFHTPLALDRARDGLLVSPPFENTPAAQQVDAVPLQQTLRATVTAKGEDGLVTLRFDPSGPALDEAVRRIGVMPLPPYIAAKRPEDDRDRSDYQTVFAEHDGSVAAPTAGLHFTPELLEALKRKGVRTVGVTLHVGAGTFLPVKSEAIADHRMHSEWGEVTASAATSLNKTRADGGRIVCVGTTSLRLLESAVSSDGLIQPFHGDTAIFITPGYRFRAVDMLVTNFHLPKSTLFMLVSAFAGSDAMRTAYAHAIASQYRFYSYGDGSLLFRAQDPTPMAALRHTHPSSQ
jgi:S-adenosylmethionine:tRNA ribosyltransferase-isomerase